MARHGARLQGGAAAPDPAAYGLSPPLFQPLTAYAARGRIFPAPARETPHPGKPICKRDAASTAETQEMQAGETTTSQTIAEVKWRHGDRPRRRRPMPDAS